MALLDTTFLIDLMSEQKSKRPSRATKKLAELVERGDPLRVPIFAMIRWAIRPKIHRVPDLIFKVQRSLFNP